MIEVIELLDDDKDISAELIAPLLAALRKDNKVNLVNFLVLEFLLN